MIQSKSKGEKTSYFNLIANHSIEIPIIQRDYAQGRPNKENIRKGFLKELHVKLENDENIDLDFVYGSFNNQKANNSFIPLDGQQRLTTLFLLHWYLAHLDDCYEAFKEKHLLNDNDVRFSYETRTSSTDFCKHLIKEDFDFNLLRENTELKLSTLIKDCPWYFYSWKNDTTVEGMLVMLDAIHQKFQKSSGFYEKLISDSNPIVTFYFLNLKEFKLTDDLYIKMNARGKPLTNFENFKAKFEKFINENHREYKEEFSSKMDKQWCDLFWDFAEKEPGKTGYDLVDKPLMNLISYFTDMLYQLDRNEKDVTEMDFFDKIEVVYKKKENLDFLVHSLNLFSSAENKKHKESIAKFFTEIFCSKYEAGKVCLFQEDLNLFDKCIGNKRFEHFDKLLLFTLMYYSWKSGENSLVGSENLKNNLRVARNFIIRIRQQKKDEYVPNIRVENYKDILTNIVLIYDSKNIYDSLIQKKEEFKYQTNNIGFEIEKASLIQQNPLIKHPLEKLEDHIHLKGAIHNFLPFCDDIDKTRFLVSSFYEIWGNFSDSLISRSLISCGDYAAHIGNSRWGSVKFFGQGDKWNRVLTRSSDKLKETFTYFFKNLYTLSGSIDDRLNEIISSKLKKLENHSWQYYFLKYSSITNQNRNIFIFWGNSIFAEYTDGISLRYAHINAYILGVFESLNNELDFLNTTKSWKKNEEESRIYCNNGIFLTPVVDDGDYWYIKLSNKINIDEIDFEGILSKTTGAYENHYNYYILDYTEKTDFVEVAVDFIRKLNLNS